MAVNVSHAQQVSLVLIPKFTASASVVGSAVIIRDIIRRRRQQRPVTPRHRLLIGMSVCDIISSSAWFFTSWPVPSFVTWTVWNYGNQQTCTAQGFFIQWGIGTVLYNACLALYYLLVIRFRWSNDRFARCLEPCLHVLAVGFALATSVTALFLGLYNPIGWDCWIAALPLWCSQSYENRGPTDCLRGDNARIFQMAFWHWPAWGIMAWLVVSMAFVYWHVRNVERKSERYSFAQPSQQRRVAVQAILFVGAMIVTWTPIIGVQIYWEVTGKRCKWWLQFLAVVLLPAQGFLNALIYFRSPLDRAPRFQCGSRSSSGSWEAVRRRFTYSRGHCGAASNSAGSASFAAEEESKVPDETQLAVEVRHSLNPMCEYEVATTVGELDKPEELSNPHCYEVSCGQLYHNNPSPDINP